MKKGISTWLMTKVVMLIFLTMTFAIILSFTGLVQQRATADAAQHLTVRVKDSIQALLGLGAHTGTRFVVMPEEIPEDAERSVPYTLHIMKESDEEVYIAVTEGEYSKGEDIESYITASTFKFEGDYEIELSYDDSDYDESDLKLNSSSWRAVNIIKEGEVFKIYGTPR